MPRGWFNKFCVAYVPEIGYCVMQAGKGTHDAPTNDRIVWSPIANCLSEDKAFEICDALEELDRGD